MKNSRFIQVGITTDNKKVLAGIHAIYETDGLPLNMIFNFFIENNLIPSWTHLYEDFKKSGMKHNRIISKIEEGVSDSYGSEWLKLVIPELEKRYGNKE